MSIDAAAVSVLVLAVVDVTTAPPPDGAAVPLSPSGGVAPPSAVLVVVVSVLEVSAVMGLSPGTWTVVTREELLAMLDSG